MVIPVIPALSACARGGFRIDISSQLFGLASVNDVDRLHRRAADYGRRRPRLVAEVAEPSAGGAVGHQIAASVVTFVLCDARQGQLLANS